MLGKKLSIVLIVDKVKVTNPAKIYWKATKDHSAILKRDLIEYYEKISDYILPHLEIGRFL